MKQLKPGEYYETEVMDKLYLELSQFTQAITENDKQLHELLYHVQNKIPGETRFETALRYIREAESRHSGPCQSEKDGG